MKLTLLVGGIAVALLAIWSATHRFEFHTAPNNIIYRCDRWTGRVDVAQNDSGWMLIGSYHK